MIVKLHWKGNPTLDVLDNLSLFKEAGVTRVSIGVQSLDNDTLKNVLYFSHTSSDVKHVITEACGLFHNAVNVDMMFGLPGQSVSVWLNHLSHMIRSHPFNHLSLYQLTLERGTEMLRMFKKVNGYYLLKTWDMNAIGRQLSSLLNVVLYNVRFPTLQGMVFKVYII